MPLVSVIMPVYNGEKYLAEAIDSILEQTFTDFELLIVDDGSVDGSAEIIRSYETQDSRICFFQLAENSGAGAARNYAISAARGQFIATMDCDDFSLPERLRKQVDFLESNPEIGIVGVCGWIFIHDPAKVFSDLDVPRKHALIALNSFIGYGFVGASVMIRCEILRAVGGYDAGRRICEDLKLFSRLLHETSIRCANLADRLYLVRRHNQPKFVNLSNTEHIDEREIKQRNLQLLWNEAPSATMDRLYQLRWRRKLSWIDRRAAKQDLTRLIEAMIAHSWVEPSDKPLLVAEMNQRLEQASPRLWQQFCHWRRHHFQL